MQFIVALLFFQLMGVTPLQQKQVYNEKWPSGLGFYVGTSDMMTVKTIRKGEFQSGNIAMAWDASVPKNEKFQIQSMTMVIVSGKNTIRATGYGNMKTPYDLDKSIEKLNPSPIDSA